MTAVRYEPPTLMYTGWMCSHCRRTNAVTCRSGELSPTGESCVNDHPAQQLDVARKALIALAAGAHGERQVDPRWVTAVALQGLGHRPERPRPAFVERRVSKGARSGSEGGGSAAG